MAPQRFAGILAVLLALPAWAAQLPEMRVEAAGEGSVIHLRNVERVALTAWTVELVGYPGSSFAFSQEIREPIAPAPSGAFRCRSKMVGAVPDYMKVTGGALRRRQLRRACRRRSRDWPERRARADLILHNGKIVTVDARFSIQQAVAIKGGRSRRSEAIEAVLARRGPNTRVIDLAGRTVLPGLFDSHVHALEAGLSEFRAPLPPLDSFAAVQTYHPRAGEADAEGRMDRGAAHFPDAPAGIADADARACSMWRRSIP